MNFQTHLLSFLAEYVISKIHHPQCKARLATVASHEPPQPDTGCAVLSTRIGIRIPACEIDIER